MQKISKVHWYQTIISDVTVGIDEDDNETLSDEARAEKEAQVNMLKQLMEEKRVEKEVCKSNDDFVNAQKLKEEIEAASIEISKLEEELELETGEWKWIRAFAIARVLLAQVKTTIQQDQYIAPLIHTLIEPAGTETFKWTSSHSRRLREMFSIILSFRSYR